MSAILEGEPRATLRHGTAVDGPTSALFTLNGARFAVGSREILAPLSMEIGAGRVTGLIGHNGSGKSTLIKLLARQQLPSGGSLAFAGKPLDAWSSRAFARKVAYLPQQPPSAAGMLVRELVALGRYPWHGALGRFGDEDRRAVADAMALTGTDLFADREVDTLSGGERQRAWIAMLVAQNADCLLLDEPISALDVAHQLEVLSLVQRLARDRGVSVVVVLHDINMAARFCDELIALKGGRLADRGSAAALMTPERLDAIYGVRMGIMAHPDDGSPIAYLR
ncbi:ATP-binding cassette domain-containing protein [Mangrovicella endophytica]|uniref:ATP-binding cassette domain-containing protein n=1 Tax=Mangrovicella endophytica TaxID=2066697 RepID=UPI000C9DD8FD|nr:ATP-binding cassette domain-containing protein [Mangrovicella endophytica]